MGQKHLKELLKEDQEPFQLDTYIAFKQCQIKNQLLIQLKKPKPVYKPTRFLFQNACFFSLHNSPDPRKSPLFAFASSVKSPNRAFLQVQAKNPRKKSGFGLFGSILKRLTHRNRTRKVKTEDDIVEEKLRECSYCSSSGRSIEDDIEEEEGFEFSNVETENGCDLEYGVFPVNISSSPTRRSSSVLSSPAKSPVRCNIQEYATNEQGSPVMFQQANEDEKQNSPVSVLDRPFQDDDHGHEKADYSFECNYTIVQRRKQHLLHKHDHKFECLSDLDPNELEKRMIDEELILDRIEDYEYNSFSFEEQRQVDEFMEDIVTKSGFQDMKNPWMRRLIFDLIIEKESTENAFEISDEQIMDRVCKRLESWEEVKLNTIDMMVEVDLRREMIELMKSHVQIVEITRDVELVIFKVLFEELVDDLFY